MVEKVFSDISVMAVRAMSKDMGDRPLQDNRLKAKTPASREESTGRMVRSNVGNTQLPSEIENLLEMPTISREYRIDEELNRVLIKLYDWETGETIREVPLEDIVKLGQKMKKLSGILLDKKI